MSETLRVRCVVCGEVLSYTPDNTAPLLQHLRSKHPCLSIACLRHDDICIRRSKSTQSGTGVSFSKTQEFMEPKGSHNGKDQDEHVIPSKHGHSMPSVVYDDECGKCHLEEPPKSKGRTVYSTTVETWRPGSSAILCSNCGHHGQPIQRRSRKKSSYSSLGAFCLLGCWPSCFLPFLTCSKRDTVNLYCAECNAFLGTLNQKSKVVKKSKNSEMAVHSAPTIKS